MIPSVLLPLWSGYIEWQAIRGGSALQEGTLRVSTKQHVQEGDTVPCCPLTLHKTERFEEYDGHITMLTHQYTGDYGYIQVFPYTGDIAQAVGHSHVV